MTLSLLAPFSAARAQDAILSRGDAVVTGFSGIKPADAPLKPGANPLDEFFIDPNGPSAQIISLAVPGGAPSGQLISAPAKLQLKASQIGQVFATALDDGQAGKVPSIYLGATSAYGLNIVVPDADGDGWPERLKSGQAGAQWMAGQFGTDLGGGPGAIYKVDGQTGTASLFASLPGNSGPGLGDIVFDKTSRLFFASDLDNGLIYRLGESGEIIDSFDHGVAGRPAKGLAPVADDGKQADIETPAFNIDNPESWGATQQERRVQGLAVQDDRLYYAVAGQVWSVGISEGFDKDARWELDVQGLPGEGQLTDMLFDKQGRLYLAQRGAQRGSYDYSLFAEPEKSAVVRYRREEPDNPATESVWVAEPESYAIGLPPEHNHAEGGIALGYPHDETGALRYGTCGEMLWSTGHRLRQSAVAQGGEGEGEADVHGLQGNAISLVRPENVPPQQAYFADYDGFFGDAAKAGHMGDVEIWQPCDGVPAQTLGQLPPGIFTPGDVPPDLPPEFPPDYEFETNLKLTKRATPKTCSPYLGGWLCQYTVRVTNTGPDNYFGPIMVRDWLPAAPAGALMGFAPTPPWTCWSVGASDNRCVRFGVFLAPSGSVELTAYALVPLAYDKCHLTNAARIEWAPPGSIWNSNPFDDVDFATANIPAKDCKPGKTTDLTIYKNALGCVPWGGNIRCAYVVAVQNLGPGTYNGVIEVEDTVPAGTTASFVGASWVPSGPVGNTYTLTNPGANLAPTAFAPLFGVYVDVPLALAKAMNCKVKNEVQITQAIGGSPQNTDSTNDTADATAIIPAQICEDQPPQSNLKIRKIAPHNAVCEIVEDWCRVFKLTVTNTGPGPFNGKITVRDDAPAGTKVDANGAGWTCNAINVGTTQICTTDNPVDLAKNPPSADSVSVYMTVHGSAADAKALGCKLTNKARIDDPLGAPKNIHAADDKDQITVDLDPKFCDTGPRSNLKIEKKPARAFVPGFCQGNPDWCYGFNIIVTNTGPDQFNGHITVTDIAPAGATVLNIGGNGWTCAATTCTTDNPVTLDKNPPSADSAYFSVTLSGTAAQAREMNCKLTNKAKIDSPLGAPKNIHPADDQDQITVDLDPKFCRSVPNSNLKLEKAVDANGCLKGVGQYHCYYNVTVTNTGPGDYNDKIVVEENIPPGMTAVFGGNWNCLPSGQDYTCTWDQPPLKKNEKAVLGVQINVPNNMAKEFKCKVKNIAEISHAPGGSDQNTDPNDDKAEAIADLPQELCDKPQSTNLLIYKRAEPKACSKVAQGWECAWHIRVHNLGGNYSGEIVLDETLPAEPVSASWNAPWTCVGDGNGGPEATCTHPDTAMASGEKRDLYLKTVFSDAQVKEANCELNNAVKIAKAQGGTPQNTDPNDDTAEATATVPIDFCRSSTIPSNLRLDKTAPHGICDVANGGWQCDYTVTATNTGPGVYTGLLEVEDTLQANGDGVSMSLALPPAYGWVCADIGPAAKRCSIANANLAVNGTVNFYVRAIVPFSYPECFLENKARITEAQGGTLKNNNAGDDNASASVQFAPPPAGVTSKCGPRVEPICPPGFRWNGERCDRGTSTPPPPTRTCLPGFTGIYPDCDPVTDDDPDCPPGSVGIYPNCRTVGPNCPPGSVGIYPNCRTVDPKCPAGTVGTYPNCRKVPPTKCPAGTVGIYPDCRDKPDSSTPECTGGRVRRGSTCVCPGSLVWDGGQCVRRKCPDGTRGVFPNCKKVIVDPPKCKKGTVGRWPNCEKIVKICPAGTVGKYPNCRKLPTHCPSGMTGKPPHCSRIKSLKPNFNQKPNFGRKPSFAPGLLRRPSGGGNSIMRLR